ncbi:MAG TPA: glycerol-3-phosphate dehydrogenase/oxidase [Thermoanaerobaculaceae bacterium]|nr:glycerol-3-phosphate dehydrogenase/oxidase [Thermoanaerobaculaceae bacterium]
MIFPPTWRESALRRLVDGFDVLVIGGGITGAGVMHDAALRGLSVGLVERGDFGCGTSSRSSKLIHGGLRYLRRMQLSITRTACRERDLLAMANPHLVWPVRFLYPSYQHDLTPGWQVDLGLAMYDHLTPVRHRHARVGAATAAAMVPQLAEGGLEFGLLYDDAAADDARLVLAVISAGVLAGGTALSYARAEEIVRDGSGRVSGARVTDLESGRVHEVRASVVVNACGVWTDEVRAVAGERTRRLRPSRGSHLLFPRSRLPLDVAVTVLSPDDGRPVFAVPHPEGTLVGTTDLFHEGPLDDPRPARDEVDYLLRLVGHAFPSAGLTARDATGAFAGVRPVLSSRAATPSEASREEAVWLERGLVSTAGGKLTTFRATAEKVVNAAARLLPEERLEQISPVSVGAAALPWRCDPESTTASVRTLGIAEAVARGMVRRLGALALPVAAGADPTALRPAADGLDVSPAELVWHQRFGGCVHLEDLLLRRVRLGMWQPRRCLELAPGLRPLLRRTAGWSVARWNAELARLERAVAGWLPPEAS